MAGSYPSGDVQSRARYLTDPVTVALSNTTNRSAALKSGCKYEVYADVAWFFKQGSSASVAATTSSIPLQAYQVVRLYVSGDADDSVAGILSAGTGTAYIVEVS